MNWLAHAFLSEPAIEARLGNLLADLVKGADRLAMSPAFLRGVALHQSIDAFTDWHPVVHRSRARISKDFRHTTGILVDLFYDHFLALDWGRYCPTPLRQFTADLYADIRANPIRLPPEADETLRRILANDRLGSYVQIEGIEVALRRVSMRLSARVGREFHLERGVAEMAAHFDALAADFAEFFPQLQAHVALFSPEPLCPSSPASAAAC